MEIAHYAKVFTADGHLGCYILATMNYHSAKHCGSCLQSQLCKRLKQEDRLSPGFQGQLGQHSETSSLKTVIGPLAPSCHLADMKNWRWQQW
uniref:PRO1880 n=1 Tax=Homo sapiens TaxID=9606 RepID=Q9UHT3_HUMAN|nr:PRO1880 [Homo sapiens]